MLLLTCSGAKKGPPLTLPLQVPRIAPLGRWAPGALPISVVVLPELKKSEQQIQDAMDWWNTRLGREVFLHLGELRDGGLIVFSSCDTRYAPCVGDDVGRAKLVIGDDGYAHRAHAWMRPGAEFPERTAAHELGHALGLQHPCVRKDRRDGDTPAYMPTCAPEHSPSVLMYPTISPGDYFLTEQDRETLRLTLPP